MKKSAKNFKLLHLYVLKKGKVENPLCSTTNTHFPAKSSSFILPSFCEVHQFQIANLFTLLHTIATLTKKVTVHSNHMQKRSCARMWKNP